MCSCCYLAAHAVQAILIAYASGEPVDDRVIINSTMWTQTQSDTYIERRRDAYIWVCRALESQDTEWLSDYNLAAGPTLKKVNEELQNPNGAYSQYRMPPRSDIERV